MPWVTGNTTVRLGDTSGSNNATMNYGGALSGMMTTKAGIIVQAGSSGDQDSSPRAIAPTSRIIPTSPWMIT